MRSASSCLLALHNHKRVRLHASFQRRRRILFGIPVTFKYSRKNNTWTIWLEYWDTTCMDNSYARSHIIATGPSFKNAIKEAARWMKFSLDWQYILEQEVAKKLMR